MMRDDAEDHEHLAATLIRESQIRRAKGELKKSVKKLEEVLESPEFSQFFEDQVKTELINKKYETYAELLRWDDIAAMSEKMHSSKQLFEIPAFQVETMIRSQLRIET